MADNARSDDPAVQRQLDRLATLSPGRDTLGLERITTLLERLGNPHRALPPVFHVAGTNGKGSTCAFLRAAIEAAGLSAHVYTSPHLVRFNERIRVAGTLIADDALAPLLAEVLDQADGIDPSFFEATTAAAFLAFSRTPTDACVIEVGLGGRLDATNVIERPLVTGIAHLGIDHEAFLGSDIAVIAAEKAGIAKRGRPLVTQEYDAPLGRSIAQVAGKKGAEWIARGRDWRGAAYRGQLHYRDSENRYRLPLPRLAGAHQVDNALLAIAMLSHQRAVEVPEAALKAAMGWADWPARLQKMEPGPLTARLRDGTEVWLDGGHNVLAAEALAAHFADTGGLHLVMGMLANKDPVGFLTPLARVARSATFLPIEGHACHPPDTLAEIADGLDIAADTASDIETAVDNLAARGEDAPSRIAVVGSLYLAGDMLRANANYPE
ncbi:bifunctional folylpolyglutamate synthase/dihydrofolate synthase [Parasphingopyxis algicola]|uniref:bifunctional folylpolyglutamate synthase/dihydrofolate synthase n=1 Tax=Parasphingopyxis algicola TaxID=2026624 RepID=UPI0015A05EBF|nr:folylpolyglutamate synthase/dihydrofolate synthase family protein [Parasphingopyxis algicola]QLC24062.1 bifunctional folylpolyglutamate synthase/dihydrofolate synthase [Parasphingopyxis algicola]